MYPSSGFCTFLSDSQLFHSLKFLSERFAKGQRNPTGRVHNRGGIGINLNLVLDAFDLTQALKHVCIFGFQVLFFKAVNSLYQA